LNERRIFSKVEKRGFRFPITGNRIGRFSRPKFGRSPADFQLALAAQVSEPVSKGILQAMANDPRIEHAKKAATAESNDAGITGARPASPVREPTFEEMGITDSIARSPFPLWLKLLYTAFLVFFVRHFLEHYADYPATEIIWFCYIGLFVLGIAMWTESPLLFSWQTLSLVVPQLIFTFDALFNIFFGPNLDSWTGYMFDPNEHMEHRLLAWFHTPMPFVLLYGVWRLGYDKRALLLQIGASWILWLLAFFFTLPHRNVNLAYGPSKRRRIGCRLGSIWRSSWLPCRSSCTFPPICYWPVSCPRQNAASQSADDRMPPLAPRLGVNKTRRIYKTNLAIPIVVR